MWICRCELHRVEAHAALAALVGLFHCVGFLVLVELSGGAEVLASPCTFTPSPPWVLPVDMEKALVAFVGLIGSVALLVHEEIGSLRENLLTQRVLTGL